MRVAPQRLSIEQCQAFIAVCETRSFSLAGERLLRSQSAITHKIKALEAAIGSALFVRSRGHFEGLTATGKRLEPIARRILAAFEDIEDLSARADFVGTIRLGVLNDFGVRGLTSAIGNFERKHPNLHVTTISDLSAKLEDKLEHKELDVALVKDLLKPGQTPAPDVLKVERLHWVSSYGFDWDSFGAALPLIVFHEGCVYRRKLLATLSGLNLRWRFAYTSHSYHSVQEAISAGLGISILPDSQIAEDHQICDGTNTKLALPDLGFSTLLMKSGDLKDPRYIALQNLLSTVVRHNPRDAFAAE